MHDPMNRRRFLHASGVSLGALMVGVGCSGAAREGADSGAAAGDAAKGAPAGTAAAGAGNAERISVQLYTLRDLMKSDMPGTLRQVAGIGYRNVEFAGYQDRTPQQVRAILDEVGLKAPSAHVPIEAMRKDFAGVLSAAEAVGHRYVICPFAQGKTEADWQRLAADLNRFGKAAQERGVQLAYHNHDFEFRPVAAGKRTPFDVLVAESDPKLVQLQLDLFWAVKAGQDPVALFEKHPGRFPLVHVKDMRDVKGAQALAPENRGGVGPHMVDVGTGEIDFRRVIGRAEQAGLQYYVVEHDNPKDPIASVRTSFGNLKGMLA